MTARIFIGKILIFTLIFFTFFSNIKQHCVFAEETNNKDIQKNLSVNYEITENDKILVSMDIRFTNQYEYKQYLKEYWINVGDSFPRNIVLTSDREQKIEYVVSQMENGRGIKVIFPDVILNNNDSYNIQIQYELPHFVRKIGDLYVIDIPSFLTSSTKIETISVKFPRSKGDIIYSSYTNYTTTLDDNFVYINIETFEPFSPLIIIGNLQTYNFTISQTYTNNGGTIHRVTLPLPQDSCTQKNIINNTSSIPQTISRDEFGNYLATYVIPEYNSLTINYSAQIVKSHSNSCSYSESKPLFNNNDYLALKSESIAEYITQNIISKDELVQLNKNEIASLFYSYLLPRIVVSENSQVPIKTIEDVPSVLDIISNTPPLYISPQDLNIVLFTLLSQCQVEAVLDWGILYPYYMDNIKVTPYVWITYWDEEDKVHTLDIVFQKLNKTSGFDKQLLDKITIYRTNDPFSNRIGWDLYESTSVFLAEEKQSINNDISTELSFTRRLLSGTENNGTLYISNTGNSAFIIDDIINKSEDVNIMFQEDIVSLIVFPGQTLPVSIKLKSNQTLYNSKTNVTLEIHGSDLANNSFTKIQEETVNINISFGLLVLTVLLTIILIAPIVYFYFSFKKKMDNPYKIIEHTKHSPQYNIPFIYMKIKRSMIKLVNKIKRNKNEELD